MLEAFHRLAAHLSEQVAPSGSSPFTRTHVPWAQVRAFRMLLHAPQTDAPEPDAAAESLRQAEEALTDSAFHLPADALPLPSPEHWSALRQRLIANRAAARAAHENAVRAPQET